MDAALVCMCRRWQVAADAAARAGSGLRRSDSAGFAVRTNLHLDLGSASGTARRITAWLPVVPGPGSVGLCGPAALNFAPRPRTAERRGRRESEAATDDHTDHTERVRAPALGERVESLG